VARVFRMVEEVKYRLFTEEFLCLLSAEYCRVNRMFWSIFLVSNDCFLLRPERNSNVKPSQNVWNSIGHCILDVKGSYLKNGFRLKV